MSTKEKMVSVRALETGFYDGARRRKGSTFPVPEGTEASWFIHEDATAEEIHAHVEKRKAKVAKRMAANVAVSHERIDRKAEIAKVKVQQQADAAAHGVAIDAARQTNALLGKKPSGFGQSPKAMAKAVGKVGGAPIKTAIKTAGAKAKGSADDDIA